MEEMRIDLLLQDQSKGLSTYLANAPHARLHAKEAAAEIASYSDIDNKTVEVLKTFDAMCMENAIELLLKQVNHNAILHTPPAWRKVTRN